MILLKEISAYQAKYTKLIESGNYAKKQNICDLVAPFRDKYGISDLDAIEIVS